MTLRRFLSQPPWLSRAALAVLVVALAAVVVGLASGLLRGLPVAESASPSESQHPSSPSATESAAPSLASPTPVATPGSDGPAPDPARPELAIALVDDLQIRTAPSISAASVGSLRATDVVMVSDGPIDADGTQWWQVESGDLRVGWVAAGPADHPYLDLRRSAVQALPATLYGLVAGDAGFLAWGTLPRNSDEVARFALLVSRDGAAWQTADPPAATVAEMATTNEARVAWGPAGWLLITSDSANRTAGTFWHSTDGISWASLPAFGFAGVEPDWVTGGPGGYLLNGHDQRATDNIEGRYFSADGQTWRAADPIDTSEAQYGLVPLASQFLQWSVDGNGTTFSQSPDGRGWAQVGEAIPGSTETPMVAVMGNQILAVLTDPGTGDQTTWRGSLPASTLHWQRASAAEARFSGTAITHVASNDSTLLVMGNNWTDASPRLWRSTDAATFVQVPLTGLFNGAEPPRLVAGARGFAVASDRYGDAGANPVLWHATDGASWQASAPTAFAPVDSPVVGACPALPATMVDWLLVPSPVATACFGDKEITFTGWSTDAGGCGGAYAGRFEPAWLAAPFASHPFVLTPFESSSGGCGSASQDPSLTSIPATQQWITITGHYDDAAAATCRWTPAGPLVSAAISPAYVIWICRNQFVATRAVPATRP